MSFDDTGDPDVRFGTEIVELSTGAGGDRILLTSTGGAGGENQPPVVRTGTGADAVTTQGVRLHRGSSLGADDDRVTIAGRVPGGGAADAVLRPGLGDDTIDVRAPGDIAILAEPVPDGRDTITLPPDPERHLTLTWSYGLRRTPVAVSNDGVADDGAPGEGDNVPQIVTSVGGGRGDDIVDASGTARTDEYVYVFGGAGDDRLLTSPWRDYVDAGPGDDHVEVLTGEMDDLAIEGGSGSDHLIGSARRDALDGGAGDDHLEGGAGNDDLDGGVGDDVLRGGEGDDYFSELLSLADRRTAGDDVDAAYGEAGDDRFRFVDRHHGRLTLRGGGGEDIFELRSGRREVAMGGPGADLARLDRFDKVRGVEDVRRP